MNSISVIMTTIYLKEETKERLNHVGIKGNSYDKIVSDLIDFFEIKIRGEEIESGGSIESS